MRSGGEKLVSLLVELGETFLVALLEQEKTPLVEVKMTMLNPLLASVVFHGDLLSLVVIVLLQCRLICCFCLPCLLSFTGTKFV